MENIQEEVLDKVKGIVKEGNTELENRISDLEVKNEKLAKEASAPITFKDAVAQAIEENHDAIMRVQKGETPAMKFTVKAAGTVTSGNISGGDIPQAQRLAGFDTIASRQTRFLDILSKGTTNADKIEYTYQANKDGSAGYTAEGAAKNQIDFDWVVGSEEVIKVTALTKVTDEMLAKGDIVAQEINNELLRELYKAVEDEAFDGSNLTSLSSVASAFDATVAGSVPVENANIVDVIAVAMTQIKVNMKGEAAPNAVFMNPKDVLSLKLVKLSASDKRYVGRLMESASGLSIDGVRIIETTLLDAGEYLIGDFSLATLYTREGVSIEMGFDADDFSKNLRTIRCEWRGALVVKPNRRPSFVFGDFPTDINALENLS